MEKEQLLTKGFNKMKKQNMSEVDHENQDNKLKDTNTVHSGVRGWAESNRHSPSTCHIHCSHEKNISAALMSCERNTHSFLRRILKFHYSS